MSALKRTPLAKTKYHVRKHHYEDPWNDGEYLAKKVGAKPRGADFDCFTFDEAVSRIRADMDYEAASPVGGVEGCQGHEAFSYSINPVLL